MSGGVQGNRDDVDSKAQHEDVKNKRSICQLAAASKPAASSDRSGISSSSDGGSGGGACQGRYGKGVLGEERRGEEGVQPPLLSPFLAALASGK